MQLTSQEKFIIIRDMMAERFAVRVVKSDNHRINGTQFTDKRTNKPRITIRIYRDRQMEESDWGLACALLAHEYGHAIQDTDSERRAWATAARWFAAHEYLRPDGFDMHRASSLHEWGDGLAKLGLSLV